MAKGFNFHGKLLNEPECEKLVDMVVGTKYEKHHFVKDVTERYSHFREGHDFHDVRKTTKIHGTIVRIDKTISVDYRFQYSGLKKDKGYYEGIMLESKPNETEQERINMQEGFTEELYDLFRAAYCELKPETVSNA